MNSQTEKEHMPVAFVSLGPGHYSKLTLEALGMLHWTDRIYCFATMRDGHFTSYAMDTILAADKSLASRIEVVELPMSQDRTAAMEAYGELASRMTAAWREGLNISACVEGSSSVYASVRTLMDMLGQQDVPWIELPGVPSFIAAAALAGVSLCDQGERLLVIPGNVTAEEMGQHLQEGCNMVIMKLSRCEDDVRRAIRLYGDKCELHYFENVSMPGQVCISDAGSILRLDRFPYFSQLIVKPRKG